MPEEDLGDWSAEAKIKKHEYFRRYLDGKPSPDDARHDPELQKLLVKLYERQREQAYKLLDDTKARMQEYDLRNNPNHMRQGGGCAPETLQMFRERFQKDYAQRCLAFAAERERHIREHQDAKTLLAEMEKREKSMKQEDTPKFKL